MELIVLGSSGAFPAAGGAASGYLLRHDGFDLWIDAGTGTLANVQKYTPFYEIAAVLVSHEHPDPCRDLGRDADLLVAEASWQDGQEAEQPYHLTSRQAARHATNAGARRLMLSHFWPGADRDVSRAQAADEFSGEIVLAAEDLSIEVGS